MINFKSRTLEIPPIFAQDGERTVVVTNPPIYSSETILVPPLMPQQSVQNQVTASQSQNQHFFRVMPNDIINGQSIPRAYCKNPYISKYLPANMDPRPYNETFDTLKELEIRIRAYTKEAGFGLVLV